jgi:hypothetical protein
MTGEGSDDGDDDEDKGDGKPPTKIALSAWKG